MTLRTGSSGLREVAVGVTREEAAGTFGEYFNDAFFTSYEDFDAEVDLSLLRSLGLVAGDGLSAVLPRVLAGHNTTGASVPRVLVGLPSDVCHRDTARRVLAAHPSVTFTQVLRAGASVLLPLEPLEGAAAAPREDVLDELSVKGWPLAADAATVEERPDAPPETTGSSVPPAAGSAWGRRRFALAGAVVLALLALIVTAVGLALGAEALLVSAILALALSQGLVLVGMLYVVRLLRELRQSGADQATFRQQMDRRTERLVRLTREEIRLQRQDLRAGQKARDEVAVVRKQVLAVGKLLGRAGAVARDHRHPE